MKIERRDAEGKPVERDLDVTPEQLLLYSNGLPVQHAFPNLIPEEREFVLSGPNDVHRLFNSKDDRFYMAGFGRPVGEQYEPYWYPEDLAREVRTADDQGNDSAGRINPRFLSRTKTEYSRVPLKAFGERAGMSNMLDSLINYLPDGVIIAGGFVQQVVLDCLATSRPVLTSDAKYWDQQPHDKVEVKSRTQHERKDIDLFFTSEAAFRETVELLQDPPDEEDAWMWQKYKIDPEHAEALKNSQSGQMRFVDYHSQNEKPDLQLIKLAWYTDAAHVIDTFDFTVVQWAIQDGELIFNPLATFDLARQRLILHRMQFPASTMRRVLKYASKGYYACPGALAEIARAIGQAIAEGVDDGSEFVYLD